MTEHPGKRWNHHAWKCSKNVCVWHLRVWFGVNVVVVLSWWQELVILKVFSNSNSMTLYSPQGVEAAHPNLIRREGHVHVQQSGLSSSAQAADCPQRTNSHSHHPKSLFNQFWGKEKLKFFTITNPSPELPDKGKNCERFIKDVIGETDLKQKSPKPIWVHSTS